MPEVIQLATKVFSRDTTVDQFCTPSQLVTLVFLGDFSPFFHFSYNFCHKFNILLPQRAEMTIATVFTDSLGARGYFLSTLYKVALD